ncbi:hypothetical protein [Pedobacter heparinus]|uniref:hypothetical protein n=1 Tax=Pedobacter heparinus TaxID=984 RepID=UPI002930D431|nr:hypothetical protein [Pedobacter heparinus]
MSLKATVDKILREKNRSLSWLAHSIGKTFDGLRLGLLNESVKYKDIVAMAGILEVSPGFFFDTAPKKPQTDENMVAEPKSEYGELKANLRTCKELITTLKDQVKDKERIISLLKEGK